MAASVLDVLHGLPDASGVPGAIADQVAKIGGLQQAIAALTGGSPSQVGQMVGGLDGLGLPPIGGIDDVLHAVDQIREALPADPSQVTAGVLGAVTGLAGPLEDGLITPVTDAIRAAQAVAALMEHLAPAGGAPHALRRSPKDVTAVATAAGAKALPGSDTLAPVLALAKVAGPLTVEAVLPAVATLLDALPDQLFPGASVPGLTRFRHVLATALSWSAMDAAGIAGGFATALEGFGRFVTTVIAGPAQAAADAITALANGIPAADMAAAEAAITQDLGALASAVRAGDLSASGAQIAEVADRWAHLGQLLAGVNTGALAGASSAAIAGVTGLPGALERGALRVLREVGSGSNGSTPASATPVVDVEGDVAAVVAAVHKVLDPLQALVDRIDLGAIREPLQTVGQTATDAASAVDQVIAGVVGTVSGLFGQLDGLIGQLDLAPVSQAIQDAIASVPQQVAEQVQGLFEPVRTAIGSGLDALEGAAGAIDLSAVHDALVGLAEEIAKLPADPNVGAAIDTVKQALQEGVDAIGSLSFSPVTDAVVADIDGVKQQLQSIDPSQIPEPARGALKAALAVLPVSFDPIESAINDEFDQLMAQGPKALLEAVKDGPAQAKQAMASFSPTALVGEALSGPFQDVVGAASSFKPSDLLKPVDDALGSVKDRLGGLDPDALLAPLSDAFAAVKGQLRALDPAELVSPLTDVIGGAIDQVVAAVPVDAVFAPIDAALDGLGRLGDPIRSVHGLIQAAAALFDALGDDVGAQGAALIDSLMARVAQVTDLTAVETALQTLRQAMDGVAADALAGPVDGALGSLSGALASLDPAGLEARLVQGATSFPKTALAALPASAERDALQAFIDGFDPLAPAVSSVLSGLASLRQAVDAARTGLAPAMETFAERYVGPNGALADLVPETLTPAGLQDLIRPSLEQHLAAPLATVGSVVVLGRPLFDGLNEAVGGFLSALEAKADTLAAVPDTVHEVQDALNAIVGSLRQLDPSLIANELHDAFEALLAKLEPLDPAAIAQDVDQAFREMLDSISIEALLPHDQIQELDDRFAQITQGLSALDPAAIVAQIEPDFQQALQPLEALMDDVSAAIDALLAKLDALDEELKGELDRVAQAFEDMLHATPV